MSMWSPFVTEELVLSKYKYFVTTQLWPTETQLNVRGWLENFTEEEKPCALHLLNGFFYFSDLIVEQLFVAAITNLSHKVVESKRSFLPAVSEWREFLNSSYFVRVTGEKPSDADSGYLFARKARQQLEVPETRIVRHEEILEILLHQPATSVVFVDDFVGSGNQFITMWHRHYDVAKDRKVSFASLVKSMQSPNFFYCPIICTTKGLNRIVSMCRGVKVEPAHLIDEKYSALAANSVIWPEELRSAGCDLIEKASERAGIPDRDGGEKDWRGFHKLALTIAFSHSVPDATLPLFYWEENGWIPLVRRR